MYVEGTQQSTKIGGRIAPRATPTRPTGIPNPEAVRRSLTERNLSGNNDEKLTQKIEANVSNIHIEIINQAKRNHSFKEGGVKIRM